MLRQYLPVSCNAIAHSARRNLSSKRMQTTKTQKQKLNKQEFVDSVLRLSPRVAAFDCDGTLWSSDAGETFFDWEIRQGVVSDEIAKTMRARYADYRAGQVNEAVMCGEMVSMHRGISDQRMMELATEFMGHLFPGRVFPELRDLIHELTEKECEIWIVSSSNEWVIRAAMKSFGIPENRILATKPVLENGIVTDRLVRIPTGPAKASVLREVVGKSIDAAFGNSRWDTEMLAMANHPFAINPTRDLATTAQERGWPLYYPDGIQRT